MSGVYIKGMKMPSRCRACGFAGYGGQKFELNVCLFTGKSQPTLSPERMPDCPLIPVPDHGRLIDADILREAYEPWPEDDECGITIDKCTVAVPVVRAFIDDQPTIIPADKDINVPEEGGE